MTPIQAFLHRPIRTEPAGRDDVVCGTHRSGGATPVELMDSSSGSRPPSRWCVPPLLAL